MARKDCSFPAEFLNNLVSCWAGMAARRYPHWPERGLLSGAEGLQWQSDWRASWCLFVSYSDFCSLGITTPSSEDCYQGRGLPDTRDDSKPTFFAFVWDFIGNKALSHPVSF